jgi:hypothetical protein
MLDDPAAMMEWLVDPPEVDELLVTDAEFARTLFQTHHAAPRDEGGERRAFVGMVVRAYELLVWIAGRSF